MTAPLRNLVVGEEIRKSFGDKLVLKGVGIRLGAGTITALMGRSGSGKSTLLRSLSLVDPPDAGRIRLLDRWWDYPSASAEPSDIWPDVTVVFQDLFLWPHLTALENITMPAKRRQPVKEERYPRELADELGIKGVLDRRPAEMSRGQRQLVAFARAVAVRPKVLLLDEITASLDVESSWKVASVLRRLRADGVTILLITHQYGFARSEADFFAYLHEGELVEAGPASILDNPATEILDDFVRKARIAP